MNLLFVCTGNTCRSPMAEAIARAEVERRGLEGVRVSSAGTVPAGGGAADHARAVVREHGLDLESFRSSPLSAATADPPDLVIAMTPAHALAARDRFEGTAVRLLSEFLPEGHAWRGHAVPDPVGGEIEDYRVTFELLKEAVRGLVDRIEAEGFRAS